MSEHVSSVEMVLKVLTLKKITVFYMPPATHGPHFTGIPNSKYSLCRSEAIQSGRRGLWLPWLFSTFPSICLKFAVLHALSSQGRDTWWSCSPRAGRVQCREASSLGPRGRAGPAPPLGWRPSSCGCPASLLYASVSSVLFS
mgnify:CR=1 FL=1